MPRKASREGYEEVHVRVGLGNGRKVRFVAALVGEWRSAGVGDVAREERYRVYQGRTGKYVLHVERGAELLGSRSDGKPAGWRGWVGVGDVKYTALPKESTLEVLATLDELRDKVPPELFAWWSAPPACRPWRTWTSDPRQASRRLVGGAR